MRRIIFSLLVGIGLASAAAAVEPRVLRETAFGGAAQRSGGEICRETAPGIAVGPEQKIWPFCLDLTCALGGDAGCALYCILTEDINTYGGYCVAGCCYCVRDEDLPPMEN
jgi:hypothetical protein